MTAKEKKAWVEKMARARAAKKRNPRRHTTKSKGSTATPRRAKAPRRAGRRRNPETESAAAAKRMFEKFHQTPSRRSKLEAIPVAVPTDLAALGKVVELHVRTPKGLDMFMPRGVTLACTPNGRQLYFVGGDQTPDLKRLGVDGSKVHVCVGELVKLVYFTRKGFHNFEPTLYVHRMGEEGGRAPELNFDTASELLYLVGGSYVVKPEGIVR